MNGITTNARVEKDPIHVASFVASPRGCQDTVAPCEQPSKLNQNDEERQSCLNLHVDSNKVKLRAPHCPISAVGQSPLVSSLPLI